MEIELHSEDQQINFPPEIKMIKEVTNDDSFKNSNIKSAYFMGVMFSGKVTEEKIKKIVTYYMIFA